MSSSLIFPSLRCPIIKVIHLDAREYVDRFIDIKIPPAAMLYIEDSGLTSRQYTTSRTREFHAAYLSMAEYISSREWEGVRISFTQAVCMLAYEVERLFEDGYFNV